MELKVGVGYPYGAGQTGVKTHSCIAGHCRNVLQPRQDPRRGRNIACRSGLCARRGGSSVSTASITRRRPNRPANQPIEGKTRAPQIRQHVRGGQQSCGCAMGALQVHVDRSDWSVGNVVALRSLVVLRTHPIDRSGGRYRETKQGGRWSALGAGCAWPGDSQSFRQKVRWEG